MSRSKSPKKKSSSKSSKKRSGKETENEPKVEEEIIQRVPTGTMHFRLRTMLQTKSNADVEFLVGPEPNSVSIMAHKCILGVESPVFERLFEESHRLEKEMQLNQIRLIEEEKREYYERQNMVTDSSERKGRSKERSTKASKKSDKNSKSKSPKASKKDSPKKSKSKSPQKRGSPKKSPKSTSSKSKKSAKGDDCQSELEPYMPRDYVKEPNVICLPGIAPIGFSHMLRYIYHDEIVYSGVVDTISAYLCARHFLLIDLAKAYLNYLESNVTNEFVLKLLRLAKDVNETRLLELCRHYLINDTYTILSRKEFVLCKKDVIVFILNQEVLNLNELELFNFVMTWALHECERAGLPKCSTNQRIVLGSHNFNLLRFPTILPHEFALEVVDSGVLSKSECISILRYYITGRKGDVPFSFDRRRKPCLGIDKLDNDSIDFSIQTDLTFVEKNEELKRNGSYEELYLPIATLPPIRTHIIKSRSRTGSIPGRWRVSDEEGAYIRDNLIRLRNMSYDNDQMDYQKKHNAMITQHFA